MVEKTMAEKTKNVWKTCSRIHKYRGTRCPYCWKNDLKKGLRISGFSPHKAHLKP